MKKKHRRTSISVLKKRGDLHDHKIKDGRKERDRKRGSSKKDVSNDSGKVIFHFMAEMDKVEPMFWVIEIQIQSTKINDVYQEDKVKWKRGDAFVDISRT